LFRLDFADIPLRRQLLRMTHRWRFRRLTRSGSNHSDN
jgi:hypothetical protein